VVKEKPLPSKLLQKASDLSSLALPLWMQFIYIITIIIITIIIIFYSLLTQILLYHLFSILFFMFGKFMSQ
jgi:hypothetical protein